MRWPWALLLLAACTREVAPPLASPSATPTPTVTARATPTPTPSATPSPAASPTQARLTYAFPVAGCRVTYARSHHDYPATDILARTGCAYVSPVRGRVDEVTYVDHWTSGTNRGADRGGLSVSIVGADGVRYYGSHLSRIAPGIRPGVTVEAGTRLGDVGTTGSARGTSPHLHFGISWPTARRDVWWVRRGVVPPAPYLDAWRAGRAASPAVEVARARRAAGAEVPPCESYCR
ncbi:MAG TPA: M23 family metallopeptidase [Frankiaceae bacterium]|nr:M23 family metallopeptidase [Frankiaceae bacterium]